METAPLHNDLAQGPDGGQAWWLNTADGVRIRAAHWPGGDKGTVFMFSGRTEYIEKYGLTAKELKQRGYGMVTVDWRGQGLADRLADDPMLGDVAHFDDYQLDVAALIDFAKNRNLPKPWFLIGHSMGGAIGLRAIHNGLDVRAAVFSAPMWGIGMKPVQRPFAWGVGYLSNMFGAGQKRTPFTSDKSYVAASPFKDNMLTGDRDMWDYMKRHIAAEPKFGLAGPSRRWLLEALIETRKLQKMPMPTLPGAIFLGTNERIIHIPSVYALAAKWKTAKLHLVPDAQHEFPMETPAIQTLFFDEADALFFSARR